MTAYDLSVEFHNPKPRRWTIWKTLRLLEFCIVVLVGSFISYFVVVNYGVSIGVVQGSSMEPTYHELDKVLVNRFTLLRRDPVMGEIVLVWQPGIENGYDIKRIAAVPGDVVQTVGNDKKYKLGANQYFVLGDNRSVSYDSRYYGPVHRVQIVGVVK